MAIRDGPIADPIPGLRDHERSPSHFTPEAQQQPRLYRGHRHLQASSLEIRAVNHFGKTANSGAEDKRNVFKNSFTLLLLVEKRSLTVTAGFGERSSRSVTRRDAKALTASQRLLWADGERKLGKKTKEKRKKNNKIQQNLQNLEMFTSFRDQCSQLHVSFGLCRPTKDLLGPL